MRSPSVGVGVPAADIEARAVTSAEELERLEVPWARLWREDPTGTPFQHPGWLIPWWRHLGEGELRTVTLHVRGRLAAVVPMARTAGTERWMLLGAGTGDYLGGLLAPALAPALVESLESWLGRNLGISEEVDWFQLRADSPLVRLAPVGNLEIEDAASEPCLALALPGIEEGIEGLLSRRFAHRLRDAWSRAIRSGPVELVVADERTWPELFEALLELHRAEWGRRGEPGVLHDPRVVASHRDSLARLIPEGIAWLVGLRQGGKLLAVYYAFIDPPRPRRRLYAYLGGFDPEAWPLSPGSLLIRRLMELALRAGCSVFDFLRGAEPYKRRWGAVAEPTFAKRIRRA